MIKYRIEIGMQAQADITDIVRYIGQVLLEPEPLEIYTAS